MAKLIDGESAPSTKTELDLWSVPPSQVAIEDGHWLPIRLSNSNSTEGPWQFHLHADPHFIQLGKQYVYIKMKIVRADGANLVALAQNPEDDENAVQAAADYVAPINLIAKTLFKQVKLMANGKLIFDSNDMYMYRAFLETELNYGIGAKTTQLAAGLYAQDKPANATETNNNSGFRWRCRKFAGSRVVEVMAPVHSELFQCDRLLLDNMELYLELHRNNDAFSLLCFGANPNNYKLQVSDMIWYVRRVTLLKSVQMGMESALQRHPAKYPVRRVQVSKIHIAPGRRATPANNLFSGQIPRRIVVGFVDTDAFYGDYGKSPFRFKNFGLNQIKVVAAGQVYPCREPITCDFDNDLYMRPYVQLFESLGMANDDVGNGITLEDFKENRCLFVFLLPKSG